MKKLIFYLLIFPVASFGQMNYYVSAKGGLNVRDAPNSKGKKIETLLYGQNVKIESKTGVKLTVNDTDKKTGITKAIKGEWVKIKYAKTFYTIPAEGDVYSNPYEVKESVGYVFNGFLKEAYFPEYIDENYIDFNTLDNFYVPTSTILYYNEDDNTYDGYPLIMENFKDLRKPKRLTSCYKYKSGILFSGTAYGVIFSNPLYKTNPYLNNSENFEEGPKIEIYIAEFKNGVRTGKQKMINPLEGIEIEKTENISLDQIGIEKEIIVKYTDLEIQYGDLQEYVYVNDVSFFDVNGNRISDFPAFDFWRENREPFLMDRNNINTFLKITYFGEYIEPKGEYGSIKDKNHFFESDCNLYNLVKEFQVIENFNIKIN